MWQRVRAVSAHLGARGLERVKGRLGLVPAERVWRASERFGERLLTRSPSQTPADAEVAALLGGRELGVWTLSAQAIDSLVDRLRRDGVTLLFEFSSGASTLAAASVLARQHPDAPRPLVVSVEQDEEFVAQVREDLERAGLGDVAAVLHAPLRPPGDGRSHSSYDLPLSEIERLLDGRRIDAVLVDGPAAEHGARVTTLPAVQRLLKGSAWFALDDALRASEIEAARAWAGMPGIRPECYDLRGWGTLYGRVEAV